MAAPSSSDPSLLSPATQDRYISLLPGSPPKLGPFCFMGSLWSPQGLHCGVRSSGAMLRDDSAFCFVACPLESGPGQGGSPSNSEIQATAILAVGWTCLKAA